MQAITNCLATSHNFGSDVVFNVCDKTQTIVPWGSLTWTKEAISIFLLGGAIYFITTAILNVKEAVKVTVTNKKK